MDWHRVLQSPLSDEVKSVSADVKRRIKQEKDERKWHQWQQMRSIDIDGHLKSIESPQARFRGKPSGLPAVGRRRVRWQSYWRVIHVGGSC